MNNAYNSGVPKSFEEIEVKKTTTILAAVDLVFFGAIGTVPVHAWLLQLNLQRRVSNVQSVGLRVPLMCIILFLVWLLVNCWKSGTKIAGVVGTMVVPPLLAT